MCPCICICIYIYMSLSICVCVYIYVSRPFSSLRPRPSQMRIAHVQLVGVLGPPSATGSVERCRREGAGCVSLLRDLFSRASAGSFLGGCCVLWFTNPRSSSDVSMRMCAHIMYVYTHEHMYNAHVSMCVYIYIYITYTYTYICIHLFLSLSLPLSLGTILHPPT